MCLKIQVRNQTYGTIFFVNTMYRPVQKCYHEKNIIACFILFFPRIV